MTLTVRQYRARIAAAVLCLGACAIARHQSKAASGTSAEILLLLDASASMQIGATPGDIAAMLHLTPCSVPGRADVRMGPFGFSKSGQAYAAYRCGKDRHDARTVDVGGVACPIPAARDVLGTDFMRPMAPPACTATLPRGVTGMMVHAQAGAPCAFACHWDPHDPPDATHDYYGVARSTVGQTPCYQKGASLDFCTVTLRADLVKNAVVTFIDSLEDAQAHGKPAASLGIFAFDRRLQPVYPRAGDCGRPGDASCRAGQDWALARGAVGGPPSLPNTREDGIPPASGGNGGDTDIGGALAKLAEDYTEAGGARHKTLILVTDGLEDHTDGQQRHLGALDPARCASFKAMGYEVAVLYTPYIPLMNGFYVANVAPLVESGQTEAALRRCASDANRDFVVADPADPASIAKGLQRLRALAQ